MDLIMLANYEHSTVVIAGRSIEVERGQLCWSMKNLAERWGWNRKTVARFISVLESDQMLSHQNLIITSLISITNYDAYQGDGTPERTPDWTPERTHLKKGKKVQEVRTPLYPPCGGSPRLEFPFMDSQPDSAGKSEPTDAAWHREVKTRLNKLYRRRETSKWSDGEIRAIRKIWPIQEEDLLLIESYYTATIPPGMKDIRRTTMATLLNNWPGEVDRARLFADGKLFNDGRAEEPKDRPLSTWAIQERLKACRERLENLERPGGCAYAVELFGAKKEEADQLRKTIMTLKSKLLENPNTKENL